MNIILGVILILTFLQVGWTGISCRSVFYGKVEEESATEDITNPTNETSTPDDNDEHRVNEVAGEGTSEPAGPPNPYSVDIYSYYSETNVDLDSLLFEPSDSRVSIDC